MSIFKKSFNSFGPLNIMINRHCTVLNTAEQVLKYLYFWQCYIPLRSLLPPCYNRGEMNSVYKMNFSSHIGEMHLLQQLQNQKYMWKIGYVCSVI